MSQDRSQVVDIAISVGLAAAFVTFAILAGRQVIRDLPEVIAYMRTGELSEQP